LNINDRLTYNDHEAAHAADARELAEEILRGMAGWRAAAASEGFAGLLGRSLSMTHVHVMFTLHKHGSMRMSELASALDVSLANATGIVTRMEERGLAERSRDADDRRVVNVTLTDEGRQLLEDMDRRRRDFFTFLLSRLSVEELTGLRNGMRAMFRSASEAMARHETERAEARSQGEQGNE
jgi:DNA-binding MarR family transcriptional regulator